MVLCVVMWCNSEIDRGFGGTCRPVLLISCFLSLRCDDGDDLFPLNSWLSPNHTALQHERPMVMKTIIQQILDRSSVYGLYTQTYSNLGLNWKNVRFFYIFVNTSWTRDWPVARPLPIQKKRNPEKSDIIIYAPEWDSNPLSKCSSIQRH